MLDAERTSVATAAQELAARGLVPGTSGNLSVLAGDHVAITATGAALDRIEPAQVVVVDLDRRQRAGEGAPSSELALHLAIYRRFPASRAVVHAHPPHATAIACTLDELPVVHYAQVQLGGTIRVAPYATFGTDELAAATVDALADRTAALMANHGAVTHGADLAGAIAAMELLEWLSALHERAAALGTPRTLDQRQQAAVLHAARG